MKALVMAFFLCWIFTSSLPGQDSPVTIAGKILDAANNSPIPYATVIVKERSSDQMITGTSTDENGSFRVESGISDITLQISFMGYETMTISGPVFENGVADLGEIALQMNSQLLDEIRVVGEKSSLEFELDKRVFNVGSDISSTGMSALEVLNKVPSVSVDIEGQIHLRGSGGVQILINGKPSVLANERSNALGTITADMIESVEVITNPSAKYDAEGTAGILNIILKKEENRGLNGSVSANTGLPDNHSLGFSMNKRTDRLNMFTQMGAGFRALPFDNKSENHDKINNTTLFSDGSANKQETFYNITLGSDYYINKYNVITLTGNYAYEFENEPSRTDYSFLNDAGQTSSAWYREETTKATNPKWQYDLQYSKEFSNDEDHLLLFSATGSFFGKDQSSEFTNNVQTGTRPDSDQKSATDFHQADYTFKLDYSNPVSENFTIDAGGQFLINDVGNDYVVSDREGDEWIADPALTNFFEYNQKVLSAYGSGGYKGEKWGIKLGLRLENTDLYTLLADTDEDNAQKYTDFFPSVHSSYKVSDKVSLQAGYSKRIFRPRLWDLNPFFNIRDNYNIRKGNPGLQPEYSDSYELSTIFKLGNTTLNSSIYHLYTTNLIERVTTFEDNVQITTPLNVGVNHATGIEINGKYVPVNRLTFNGDFNWNYYSRTGEYENQSFDFSGKRWSGRLVANLALPADFEVEITGQYQSGFKTIQSEVSGSPAVDLGIRKKINKGKFVVNLGVRDLFDSRYFETITDQPDYYLYSYGSRRRSVTLGVSYGFGKGEAMSYFGGKR